METNYWDVIKAEDGDNILHIYPQGVSYLYEQLNEYKDGIEDEFIEKVRTKIGADVEVLEAESGLNQCLTNTPTIYALTKSE